MTAKELRDALDIITTNPKIDLDSITITHNHYGIYLWIFDNNDYDLRNYYTVDQLQALDDIGFCRYDDTPNAFYSFT